MSCKGASLCCSLEELASVARSHADTRTQCHSVAVSARCSVFRRDSTRAGLIALIIVTYGLDLGIITKKFFAILVLMVLVTTIQTVPLVLCVDPPSRAAQSALESAAWEEGQNRAREAAAAAAQAKRVAAGGSGGGSLSWFPFRRRARASSWPRDAASTATAAAGRKSMVVDVAPGYGSTDASSTPASAASSAPRGRGRWAVGLSSRRDLTDSNGSSSPSLDGRSAAVIPVTGNVAHRESMGVSVASARAMSPSRVVVHNPLRSQPSPAPSPPPPSSTADAAGSGSTNGGGSSPQHLPSGSSSRGAAAGFSDGAMSAEAAAEHASAGLPSAVARARLSLYRPPPPPVPPVAVPFSPSSDDREFPTMTV